METAPLRNFAMWARTELIAQVRARITTVLAPASSDRTEHPRAIGALETDIRKAGGGEKGRSVVAEQVAYTWFNRIIAMRFMDANGYTAAGVVSPLAGQTTGQPEVLADAKRGTFDPDVISDQRAAVITGLLDGTRPSVDPQGEAYTQLLAEYCRYWHKWMPFMFEREGDYTELLIPGNLLADESIMARAVSVMTPDVCKDVEVIGWLYQFYISQRKDEVFEGFKKNKKAGAAEIPAATQLFTPHWIVRYLVENSVGRLWMLNHPESHLVDQMKYYIAPVDEENDFLRISSPEELTVIDPACGSGHMLTYAFDLLYAIYEEEGYSPSVIPSLILTKNLFGTEIDGRAGALAAFALTMKARAKQRTFFTKGIQPHICVIKPISFSAEELDFLISETADRYAEEAFWNQFEHADVFGSLIRPDAELTDRLERQIQMFDDGGDILHAATLAKATDVIEQAKYLSRQYSVAVANPPYMGSKQMGPLLAQFMKDEYEDEKQDLYGGFVVRGIELVQEKGLLATVIGDTWMSIKSFEALRKKLLLHHAFGSFVHLHDVSNHADVFGANAAFVLSTERNQNKQVPFVRLTSLGSERKESDLKKALNSRNLGSGFYLASGEDFAAIPGSPIVYWLSEKMRAVFGSEKRLGDIATLAVGLQTGDNSRFLRQWWEVSHRRIAFSCTSHEEAKSSGARWFPYNKGGEFRKWYGNQEYVVNWENDGEEIRIFGTENGGRPRSRPQNTRTYFSPSVSWSDISSGEAAFRRFPQGFIHDSTGHSGFGAEDLLDQIALLLNSRFVVNVMQVVAPTMHFHIGYVGLVPVAAEIEKLSTNRTNQLVEISKCDWNTAETSWDFECNPLVESSESARPNLPR